MSNKTNEHEDQAEELRKIFNELQQVEKEEETHQIEIDDKTEQKLDIDILNLPPRKEVHGKKKKRTTIKISVPLMRLLIVTFILIIVLAGAYYLWGEEIINLVSDI